MASHCHLNTTSLDGSKTDMHCRRLEMCEPFSFEDGGQVILDSAEDGGRSGRVSAQHEVIVLPSLVST